MPSQRNLDMADDLDRAKGAMMATMPIAYRMKHGQICSSNATIYPRCWHVSQGPAEVQRVAECWACAEDPSTPCCPMPMGMDHTGEFCEKCRVEGAKGREDKEKLDVEEMRRQRKAHERMREEKERERMQKQKQKQNVKGASAGRDGGREKKR